LTAPKLKLRDRDAIVTNEGIILRVYGYAHPPEGFVCDPEYAPESVRKTSDPKAYRKGKNQKTAYYKFYFDEGLRFIRKNYPQYTVFYKPLRKRMVGVKQADIEEVRKPETRIKQLTTSPPKDVLIEKLQQLIATLKTRTNLTVDDFGVFGSLLHGFHHPRFSDIDLIFYGKEKLETLRQALQSLYGEKNGFLSNEFENEKAIGEKRWQFRNYSPEEFVWHQRRKLVYGLWKNETGKRVVKVEFEPVKGWKEIRNEYDEHLRITREGWIKATARVIDDADAPSMPAIYRIEPLKVEGKVKADNIRRILSYVEEFRMQAEKDETVYVEGNLEKVTTKDGNDFHQITLSHGPRYFEQTLKVKTRD